MKFIKRLTAIGIIILASNLLAGCDQSSAQINEGIMNEMQQSPTPEKEEGIEKTVALNLETSIENSQLRLSIFMENPEKEEITAIRTWLTFNPEDVEGVSINTEDSDFSLEAPGENEFDNEQGILKIGRSTPGFTNKEKLKVAEVIFELKTEDTIMISPFNYKEDISGNVSAYRVINQIPQNILIQPNVPALIVQDYKVLDLN